MTGSKARRVGQFVGHTWKRGIAVVVLVVVVAVVAVGVYFATPLHGQPSAVDAVTADDDVLATETVDGYVLTPPAGVESRTGLVFYPGGRVHPDAYLPTLAPLVREANVTVVVPSMPLNLAVLDVDAADRAIDRHPGVERWYVGGHSLGGAMACRYAGENPDRVEGVVLFAAYCDRSLGGTELVALSVTGGDDAVLDRNAYRENLDNLPENATVVEIDGMNHSQFGAYTGQRGGQPARLNSREAHRRLAAVVLDWLESVATGRPNR